ncbi:MAG: serine/threonine protein kinase [Polyangiaceae bacterium]|jgi:serine/threonine-protein kinase|nr:serine/threonine protein kinase [Polyangiaceae bacterium]
MSVDVKVASTRAQARIGSVIKDKWRLDRLLGVGGMACVYAATHRNKKRAAVKMLHVEYSNDRGIRDRFLREGYLANSVGHRGVVTVDDDDIAEDGSAFIVMELLDGETLEQRWRRKGHRLPLEEVLAVADQVLDALAAAHDQGVVHRDLKPENLFLTRDRVVKLLDFGIGRLKELQPLPTTTLSGATMGTPAFMAPEQAKGRWEDVDGQTDLWALGATLFTLLTGEYVHEAQTVNETLALAVTRPARPIRSVRPDLPGVAAALIDRSLSFAKAQRFPDARAMQAEVRRVYAELSGNEGTHHSPLAVPEPEPLVRLPVAQEATDPRLRFTTARGVSASGLPAPRRAAWAPVSTRRWVLWGGVMSFSLLLVVLMREWASSRGEDPPSAPPVSAIVAPVGAAPAPAPPEASAPVPHVSVDQLPQEPRKKSGAGAGTPAKKDDPFARRR